MTEKLALTLDQIRDIFRAGSQRGQNEAVAFEWGSTACGKPDDDLAEALHEIANEGIEFFDPRRVPWGTPAEIFEAATRREF